MLQAMRPIRYQVQQGDRAIEINSDSEACYTFDVSSGTLLFRDQHVAVRAFPGRHIVHAASDEHAVAACEELQTWKKQNHARSLLIKGAGPHLHAVQSFLHRNNTLDTKVVYLDPPVEGYKKIEVDDWSVVYYRNTEESMHGFIFDDSNNNIQTEFMLLGDSFMCWDMNLEPAALAIRTRHLSYLWDMLMVRRRERGRPIIPMPPINLGYPAASDPAVGDPPSQ